MGALRRYGLVVVVAACGSSSGDPEPAENDADPAVFEGEATLPEAAGRFAPAHTRLAEDASIDGAHLGDVDGCGTCHADAAAQWATSAHAFASFNNPIYRVSIEDFRGDVGNEASRFCGGCHDVALLVDGALDADAIPPADVRTHAGITCRTCHGVTATAADGNGSYTLRPEPIPVPIEGDAASLRAHRRAVSRDRLGPDLCASCHRSFLGQATGNSVHLAGMDDATPWQSSPHGGNGAGRVDSGVEPRDCAACHMEKEPATRGDAAAKDGVISSHRFLGGHTLLAAMRRDRDGLARARAFLADRVSIDVAAARDQDGAWTLPADGAPLTAGGHLDLDVVVRNLDVGHRFPAGVRDAQDTWIQVEVRDARGRVIAASGAAHADDPDDREAHVLRANVADENGKPRYDRRVHTFRAPVADHTIPPRDAAAIRYRLAVPEDLAALAQPLTVTARLRHRSRNLALVARACDETRTARGRAFAAGSRTHRGLALDACVTPPITDLATASVELGDGATPAARGQRFRRLYEHGLALTHSLQERLGEAIPSLEAALEAIDEGASGAETRRAMIHAALGLVAGRQGRTEDALAQLDRAAALAPAALAIDAHRGEALARVWRWRDAVKPLRRAAANAPGNLGLQRRLAVALGSAGVHAEALEVARRGLALSPRDGDLLRVQALALSALGAPPELSAEALDAYDVHRSPDRAMDLRVTCTQRFADCARERPPVHTHELAPPR